jgi:hypothetical protein
MTKEGESNESSWKYSGNENEWDVFDRRMMRYMRKKYDDFGEKMWLGEIEVVNDNMDPYDFLDYCDEVMKAIEVLDSSEARRLKKDSDTFEDPRWQYDWMKRQLRLMADFVESHAEGQAEIEMINYNGDLRDIRKHLYKQFGSGSGSNIHEKELEFDRGMAEKGKAAFPLGCDMGEKLRELESRRLYFSRMAGTAEKRRTYPYCQESKLVRIVLEHVNKQEYGECLKRVLEKVKVKKLVQDLMEGGNAEDEDTPDNHDRSFSDDWLPSWKMLKAALLDEWSVKKIEKGSSHEGEKKKNVLPVALSGVKKAISCYGCGKEGHRKGDPSCQAGKFDVHANAPKDYKERMAKGRKREAEMKQNPKSPGANNKKGDGDKKHCHAFNFGKGTCRFGAKCRFLHEKSEGGGKVERVYPSTTETGLDSSIVSDEEDGISNRQEE